MQNLMSSSKKIVGLVICLVILISSLFIANEPALAEFSRGTVQNGRFNSTKVVLDRRFKKPDGYIKKRELQRITPLNKKVNVYNEHGEKIGFAEKALRADGLNVYDKKGKKVGFYRDVLGTPKY